MTSIIWTSNASKSVGNSERARVMTFIQKLTANPESAGLRIKAMQNARDPRCRTARVDDFWRAVLFELRGGGEIGYVVYGVYPHDDGNDLAQRAVLRINPVNGLAEFDYQDDDPALETKPAVHGTRHAHDVAPSTPEPALPIMQRWGFDETELTQKLGLSPALARAALAAPDEDALLDLASRKGGWAGEALFALMSGEGIDAILQRLRSDDEASDQDVAVADSLLGSQAVTPATSDSAASASASASEDEKLWRAIQLHGSSDFFIIDGEEALRNALESSDFTRWRVFLHPEQKRYATRKYRGAFRLSGGAGTGKTVVLVHRARNLCYAKGKPLAPPPRVVLTTFAVNLANALAQNLRLLDPPVGQVEKLGEEGVFVRGVDSLAMAIVHKAASATANEAGQSVLEAASQAVLGRSVSSHPTPQPVSWRDILDGHEEELPAALASEAFLSSEYELVVLPNNVRSEVEYLRVRRAGRGIALDRNLRRQVWKIFESYRQQSHVKGVMSYAEIAAVAAACFTIEGGLPTQADHVLVDEGQDLKPSHWMMLRAIVEPGENDLFIAEDSHQRIYAPKIVLSRYGINIRGRSRRLSLNYRTTAQNLKYALGLLHDGEGGSVVQDLEGADEKSQYFSVRRGPEPRVLRANSDRERWETLATIVREWEAADGAGEGRSANAVLVGTKRERDMVVSQLERLGVMQVRSVERDDPEPGTTAVMTMHRAKGLEFQRVVLLQPERAGASRSQLARMDPADREDREQRDRALRYVSATRARDELVVLG